MFGLQPLVLQLERGEYAGSKNVQGAILYADALEKVIPDFRDDAPLPLWMIFPVIFAALYASAAVERLPCCEALPACEDTSSAFGCAYVLEGELRHRDSEGSDAVIYPGLAQRMTPSSAAREADSERPHA